MARSIYGEEIQKGPGLGNPITAPSTDAAKQWDGWGTALKPAHEPIVLARKPLDGTVANNVLTHGVGALNIDASRVGSDGATYNSREALPSPNGIYGDGLNGGKVLKLDGVGRWPANFIHDGSDEVLELFPDTGKSQGGRIGKKSMGNITNVPAGQYEAGDPGYGDSGSAARFFYCAKASRTERNTGLDQLPAFYNKRDNGFSDKLSDTKTPRQNFHPTVKPLALIHYLIKLVTPPGGTILDPFLGSGTTAVAATQLGHPWIGCELTEDYWPIIEARVNHAQQLA
jgi:site-specific DNA-methyltransferase (adenine-specific)